MRILATSCPNQGHFYPMVPFLWALRNAGHDVRVAMTETMAGVSAAAGLPSVSLGPDIPLAGLRNGRASAPPGPGVEAMVDHVLEYYVPLSELIVDRVVDVTGRWRPDLLVHTAWDYAGSIAAARLGVPVIQHGWGLTPPKEIDDAAYEELRPLLRQWNVPDHLPGPWRWVDVCPPSLQIGLPDCAVLPMVWSSFNGGAVLPEWLLDPPDRPRICVTLGNIPIMLGHAEVFRNVLAALRDLDAEVIVAASGNLPQVDDLPEHVRIVRGIPLREVLGSCRLMINHGGSNSVMAAIAAGLPQLVLPQTCVHFQHGDRIAGVGAGESLHPQDATVAAIRAATVRLLTDEDSRATASRLGRENARQLSPESVVSYLDAAMRLENTGARLPAEAK
ncbi:nucleotide disphospho-sugar-binding domain-containing protein [Amycolatopsis jejuensis]|uniref:nucleotide disphospho-sugar-binding domain-containing protein n=1 Tax=Amycolatopsis jejuensis TaxID=330084 RepID=UPI0005246084|nr:nucleotide disphospho-sugar-binding domain-containing protein [Amycolatopsis jejuensis]